MEATTELLQKLQRRRERMGERAPLRERDIDNTPSDSRNKDFEDVKVRQRRTLFEGSENQAVQQAALPGKLDLARWQQSPNGDSSTPSKATSHRSRRLGAAGESDATSPVANSANGSRQAAERVLEDTSTPAVEETSAVTDVDTILPTEEAASPASAPSAAAESCDAATSPGRPGSSSPSGDSECAQIAQAASPASDHSAVARSCDAATSPAHCDVATSPLPARESDVSQAAQVESMQSGKASESSPSDHSGSGTDAVSPSTICAASSKDTDGSQQSIFSLALGSQAPSAAAARRQCWPGRHLGRGSQASSQMLRHAQAFPSVETEDQGTQILRPLQQWSKQVPQPSPSCVYSQLSRDDAATPSPSKAKSALVPVAAPLPMPGADAAGGMEVETARVDAEDGDEPLEYFLLDYIGVLPEAVVDKLSKNIEIHEDFVRQLTRRNEKLASRALRNLEGVGEGDREAASQAEVDPRVAAETRRRELAAREAASRITAAQEAHKRVAAEAYEAAMHAKLTRTCRRAEARIASATRKAGQAEEDARKKKQVALLERARALREFENANSEIFRTETNIAELEDAIRVEGRKFRDKEAERKAVAKEVEALRCEARAHRARAGKHLRTERRAEDVARELEGTRAAIKAAGKV